MLHTELVAEVRQRFQSKFPSVKLSAEWLEQCVAYLVEELGQRDVSVCAKSVEEQFLLADLHDAVALDSSSCLSKSLLKAHGGRTPKLPLVLQIVGLMDISVSAMVLLDRSDTSVKQEQVDTTRHDKKPGAAAAADKSCYKLTLSDGHHEILALEYEPCLQPRDRLQLIGAKLSISQAPILRYILVLDRKNTVCLGGAVEELVPVVEAQYRNDLLKRLKKIRPEVSIQID